MNEALLDTDILSEVFKQRDAIVVTRASDYFQEHRQFAFSAVTWYEVLRGLKNKNASQQIKNFDRFCRHTTIFPITEDILERAADLWVEGERTGKPHRDADLIIASTALEHGRVLVTGNRQHFSWIQGLDVENWRAT